MLLHGGQVFSSLQPDSALLLSSHLVSSIPKHKHEDENEHEHEDEHIRQFGMNTSGGTSIEIGMGISVRHPMLQPILSNAGMVGKVYNNSSVSTERGASVR